MNLPFGVRTSYRSQFRVQLCPAALRIFEKHGITHVGYWVPQDFPGSSNTLIYIVSHDSREVAQKSWGAFLDDPEWQRVKEESQADGRIVANAESVFIEATDFSPGQ